MTSPARTAARIVAVTLLADQLAKVAVMRLMVPGQSVPLLPPVLHLTYVQNTGAAFGIFKGLTAAFIVLSLAVSVWIFLELRRIHRRRVSVAPAPGKGPLRVWALSLVLAGAVGNLIDRIRLGHVVDFIDLRVWPVFNVADSAITIGVALLLYQMLRLRDRDRLS